MNESRQAKLSEAILQFRFSGRRWHVIPDSSPASDRWAVKRETTQKASKVFAELTAAVEHAKSLARGAKGEVIVHQQDGTIRDHYDFRHESLPAQS